MPEVPELLGATTDRLNDQIEWYSRRSRGNQQRYKIASALEIVLAATIVVVSAGSLKVFDFALPAVLAAVLTIIKGIETVYGWQANWANYRTTAEALKREKYLHAAGAGPYVTAGDVDRLLAERIEEIISRENLDWMVRAQSSSAQAEPHDPGHAERPKPSPKRDGLGPATRVHANDADAEQSHDL